MKEDAVRKRGLGSNLKDKDVGIEGVLAHPRPNESLTIASVSKIRHFEDPVSGNSFETVVQGEDGKIPLTVQIKKTKISEKALF